VKRVLVEKPTTMTMTSGAHSAVLVLEAKSDNVVGSCNRLTGGPRSGVQVSVQCFYVPSTEEFDMSKFIATLLASLCFAASPAAQAQAASAPAAPDASAKSAKEKKAKKKEEKKANPAKAWASAAK
jgi:hypothetical protein